jgi:nitrogen fixation protein NifU and related proteins
MEISIEKDESPPALGESFFRHARTPFNRGCLEAPHGYAKGVGSCGDSIELTLRLRGETIAEVGHRPVGCDYTVACASAVSILAIGKTLEESLQIQPEDVERELGGLPEDHRHCARLAVNTLGDAVADVFRHWVEPKQEEKTCPFTKSSAIDAATQVK